MTAREGGAVLPALSENWGRVDIGAVGQAQHGLWNVSGRDVWWERWTGQHGARIAIDRFGASAPGEIVFTEYGFTVEIVLLHRRR